MVFMDKVVTMEHVDTLPWCVPSHNTDGFTRGYPNDILFTRCLVWHHIVTAASARKHLEINEVDMNRMRGISTSVSQFPNLVLA
jgi:hypothetical protein